MDSLSGVKVSQEAMESIATILGLTEKQTKVYIAAMGIGTATLGQLSQKSGVHVLEAAEAINDLEKQGLLKKIPGIITRFVPLEPFLRAHTLEFDPVTLLNISDSIKAQLETTKSQLSTLFGEISNKVDVSINQVAIDITESATWKEDLSKLKDGFQNITTALKTGLDGFSDSKEKMILELRELEKALDEHIHTSVEASNQVLREVHSNLHTTSMIARHELVTQVQDLLSSLTDEIRGSLVNMKKTFETTFQTLKTTKQNSMNHFVTFQESIERKSKEISENFTQISQNHLKALNNVDEKLSILDNLITNCKAVFDFAQLSHKNLESATEKLSFLYGDIDGRRLFSGKKETLEAISAIQSYIEEVESTYARRKEELEISLKNAQNKMESEVRGILRPTVLKIVSNLKNNFEKLQKESTSEVRGIIERSQESVEKLEGNTITKTEKAVVEGIDTTKKTLSQSLETFNSALEDSTINFNRNMENIVESGAALSNVLDSWRDLQQDAFTQLYQSTSSRLDATIFGLTAIDADIDACLAAQHSAEETFATVAHAQATTTHQLQAVAAAKAAVALKGLEDAAAHTLDALATTLDEPISAIIFKMKSTKENLETIFDASRAVELEGLAGTYPIVGESSVILFMRDLVRRTKNELDAVMLVPELQTLTLASKLPARTRVTFIGNWDKIPEARLRKLLTSGTIRMKKPSAQHPLRLWLFIRDKAEILIAPEPDIVDGQPTELVGIVSTSDSLIRLFTEEMSTIKIRSKDLVLQMKK